MDKAANRKSKGALASDVLSLFLALAVTLFFSGTVCYAQCNVSVPGGTISGETWTVAGSPYCIEGDLLINSLTIEPGVKVQLQGDYVLEVQGVLVAVGTAAEHIVFTAGEDHELGWQGIYFNDSLPGCELSYCTVEDSIAGAIEINSCSPTISNCLIRNNSSTSIQYGGGIYTNAELTLENCVISDNSISRTTSRNSHVLGGGIYSSAPLTLRNCSILNNSASCVCTYGCNVYTRGGGIYCGSDLTLENCIVDGNTAYARGTNWSQSCHGGGIYSASGHTSITGSIVSNNWASGNTSSPVGKTWAMGGGIFVSGTFSITSSAILFNDSLGNEHKIGGGIQAYASDEEATISHCTIRGNGHQGVNIGSGEVQIVNSIIWANASSQVVGNAAVRYSDIEGGYSGLGNMDLNPVFIDDFHLDTTISPCIDAGDPTHPSVPFVDIDGEDRLLRCNYDMGADEVPGDVCRVCTDEDGDGYGFPASIGCTHFLWDCDDSNGTIYPGAPEVCDCVDNQCPGDAGYGVIDESGGCVGCGPCSATAEASEVGANRKAYSYDPLVIALILLSLVAIRAVRRLKAKE